MAKRESKIKGSCTKSSVAEQTHQTPDDLEAGVDHQEVLELSDEEIDDFIEDADNEDDTSDAVDAPTADPSVVTPLPGQSKVEEPWTELLDRARMRATRGPTVGERHDDVSIHDVPSEFWVLTVFAGWEDVVIFHIGCCARPEHRIKAAFMMLLLEKQVWLEAEMSALLKEWLKDIPGVHIRDQQLLIHSISPQDGIGTPLTTKSYKPLLDGTEKVKVVKKTEEQYLWHGFVYEHDLLVRRVNFSQVELAREIPDILFGDTANTFPEFLSGVLFNGRVGLVSSVGDKRLEIECEEGLFPLAWAHCRKTFEVGQYMEMTDELIDRWAGWIDAIEDGLIHVVSCQTRTKDKVKMHEVHPNILMASTPPSSLPPAPKKDQEFIHPTKNISWKGNLVTITQPHHCWRSKTGYVEDVNVSNNSYNRPGLRVLVHLATYDPNTPYPDAWFDYLNVVDEETHLPLNEALPLADNDDNLYHKYVPVTHFLEERGRRRLHGYKFCAIYHGLKISAAACANSIDGVISGEHCGKWVRGIQFKKGTSQDCSDLEWTVMVIIPRALYLQDDLTDERLVLHSSCMTLADESAQERKLNDSLKRLLWKPAREH
ncbi:hypothetical protein EDD18DRAFT_1110699 [Armillaria luteobubalina]|uniref:Uncharacterized protein n=1 Tax=Armillaria luteobubalina TaxID=153913 RepID=A0AA39PPI0_9AGAR|nr:hypothetical protein EDD18DRAFT_1110699 [Armillaria luteobubalina]